MSVDERPPEASTADAAQGPTTWTVGEILRSVFRRRVPPLTVLDLLVYREDPDDVMDDSWSHGRSRRPPA